MPFRLEDARFQSLRPLPEFGYVPVGLTGPTIRGIVHNSSRDYVADIRIRLRATDDAGAVLAEEVTATPGHYFLLPPKTSQPRTFVFDSPDTKFVQSDEWKVFEISVDVLAARFVSPSHVSAGK